MIETEGRSRRYHSRPWGSGELLVAWILTRVGMLLLVAVPAERDMTVDVRYYLDVATRLLHGQDIGDWEYPVVSLVVVVAPLLLGLSDPSSYLVGFAGLTIVLDFFTFICIASMPGPDGVRRGAWLWVAGPPLLGLVSITRLDLAACAATAGAARLLVGSHSRWSGALLGLGAAIKVWPAALLVAGGTARHQFRLLSGALVAVTLSAASCCRPRVGTVVDGVHPVPARQGPTDRVGPGSSAALGGSARRG